MALLIPPIRKLKPLPILPTNNLISADNLSSAELNSIRQYADKNPDEFKAMLQNVDLDEDVASLIRKIYPDKTDTELASLFRKPRPIIKPPERLTLADITGAPKQPPTTEPPVKPQGGVGEGQYTPELSPAIHEEAKQKAKGLLDRIVPSVLQEDAAATLKGQAWQLAQMMNLPLAAAFNVMTEVFREYGAPIWKKIQEEPVPETLGGYVRPLYPNPEVKAAVQEMTIEDEQRRQAAEQELNQKFNEIETQGLGGPQKFYARQQAKVDVYDKYATPAEKMLIESTMPGAGLVPGLPVGKAIQLGARAAPILGKGFVKGAEAVGAGAERAAQAYRESPLAGEAGFARIPEIKVGDVVKDIKGRIWKVLNADDPSMLAVESEQGVKTKIGRATVETPPSAKPPTAPPAAGIKPSDILPDVDVESLKVPQWIKGNIQQNYETANRLGVTDEIINLCAEGKTAKQVAQQIQTKVQIKSPQMQSIDIESMVRGVRSMKGIPPVGELGAYGAVTGPEVGGKSARQVFLDWQKEYFAKLKAEVKPPVAPVAAKGMTPSIKIKTYDDAVNSGRYLVKGDDPANMGYPDNLSIGGTWATSYISSAKRYGKQIYLVDMPKNILEADSMQDLIIKYGLRKSLKESIKESGYDAVRFSPGSTRMKSGVTGTDEIWILDRPKLLTIEEVSKVVPPVIKEPWQMTLSEFAGYRVKEEKLTGVGRLGFPAGETARLHKESIIKALSEGKPVPPEVLKHYPDLAKGIPAKGAVAPEAKPAGEVSPIPESFKDIIPDAEKAFERGVGEPDLPLTERAKEALRSLGYTEKEIAMSEYGPMVNGWYHLAKWTSATEARATEQWFIKQATERAMENWGGLEGLDMANRIRQLSKEGFDHVAAEEIANKERVFARGKRPELAGQIKSYLAEIRKYIKDAEAHVAGGGLAPPAKQPPLYRTEPPLTDIRAQERVGIPSATGEAIAKELGVKFNGVEEGRGMQFTDTQTGSTTYGNTLEEVKAKLADIRQTFAKAKAEDKAKLSSRIKPIQTQEEPIGIITEGMDLPNQLKVTHREVLIDVKTVRQSVKGRRDIGSRFTRLILDDTERELGHAGRILGKIEAGGEVSTENISKLQANLVRNKEIYQTNLAEEHAYFKDVAISTADYNKYILEHQQQLRQRLSDFVKETLPLDVRGKMIADIKNVKTVEEFEKAIAKVENLAELTTKKSIMTDIQGIDTKDLPEPFKARISNILQSFDIKYRGTKFTQELEGTKKYLERMETEGQLTNVPAELIELVGKTRIQDLTVDQLTILQNELEGLVSQGKLKNKLISIQADRRVEKAVTELVDHLGKPPPIKPPITAEALKQPFKQRIKDNISGIISRFDRMERILYKLDNYEDNGKLQRFFYEPINKATDIKTKSIYTTMDEFRGMLQTQKIDLELTLKGTQKIGDAVLTPSEKIGVYLHSLNEDNLTHLKFGNKFSDDLIKKVTDSLTPQEKAIADWIHDYFVKTGPEISKIRTLVEGKSLGIVEDYFPIILNWDAYAEIDVGKQLAQETLLRFTSKWASTKIAKGFLKARTHAAMQPVQLDAMQIFINRLESFEHYKNFAPVIRDLQLVAKNQQFRAALVNRAGKPIEEILNQWLKTVADTDPLRVANHAEKVIRQMRVNATTAVLGWNITSALKQFPSFFTGMTEAGELPVLKGLFTYLRHPQETRALIKEYAPQIFNRSFEREIEETKMMKNLVSKVNQVMSVREVFTFLSTTMDKLAVSGIWRGTFDDMLRQGKTAQEAASYATKTIRKTQAFFSPKDLPEYYRSGEMMKALTIFTNELNNLWQLTRYEWIGKTLAGKQSYPRLALKVIEGVVVPSLLIGWISRSRPAENAKEFAQDVGNQALSMIPIIGNTIGLGYQSYRGTSNLITTEILDKVNQVGYQMNQGKWIEALKDMPEMAGYAVGVPVGQPKRTIEGIVDLATSKSKDWMRLIYSKTMRKRAEHDYGWEKDVERYYGIPSNDETSKVLFRKTFPDVEAKLFLLGDITSFRTEVAARRAIKIIEDNEIDPMTIKGITKRLEDRRVHKLTNKPPLTKTNVDLLIDHFGLMNKGK